MVAPCSLIRAAWTRYPQMAALLSSMWHHSPRERPCAKKAADKVQDMLIAIVENRQLCPPAPHACASALCHSAQSYRAVSECCFTITSFSRSSPHPSSNKPLAWISRKTGISVAKAGNPGTQDDAKHSTRSAQGNALDSAGSGPGARRMQRNMPLV